MANDSLEQLVKSNSVALQNVAREMESDKTKEATWPDYNFGDNYSVGNPPPAREIWRGKDSYKK